MVSPSSVTFSSGVWTGNVTVSTLDPAATLQLSNVAGATGISNSFAVVAQTQVASTTPASGGILTLPSPLTYDVSFSRPITPSSVTTSSLVLSGISGARVTGVTVQPGNATAVFTIGGITAEGVLTASMAAGAVTDEYGFAVAAFSASYVVDVGTEAFPAPLTAVNPLGSLVYGGSATGIATTSGGTDSFTINVDAGQTLTAYVTPAAGMQPTLTITGPGGATVGSATASAAGGPTLVQTVPVATAGTYTLTVGSAAGMGTYTLGLELNAAVETALYGGATDNSFATAQSLNPAFVSLGGTTAQRAAVLGATEASASDYYSFTLAAGEAVTVGLTSLATDSATLDLYDSGQNHLAAGVSSANMNRVIGDFVATVAGTYYVKIGGNGAAYNLVVVAGAAFDTQPNSTSATARISTAPKASWERSVEQGAEPESRWVSFRTVCLGARMPT